MSITGSVKTVCINASSPYDVTIGPGLLEKAGEIIRKQTPAAGSVLLVSDDTVFGLYGRRAERSLAEAGFSVNRFVFPYGEASKNLDTYGKILECALSYSLARNDLFVSLGGGVVSDITGFAAATYKRGTAFASIPTTLLSAVDASVGGKTGVDVGGSKNQAGAFHQPVAVICDTELLATLPRDQYLSGCAEIIKCAVLDSEELFGILSAAPAEADYQEIITRSVMIKKKYVEKDEFDRGLRMMLNLGHTFGHAAEALGNFKILHGFAVAAGMATVTAAAAKRGICGKEDASRIVNLIRSYGLPDRIDRSADEMMPFLCGDKKASGGRINLIVPEKIGKCRIVNIPSEELREWMADGGMK